VLPNGLIVTRERESPASPFIVTRRGGVYVLRIMEVGVPFHESRGAVAEYYRKYTMGHGVRRGSRPRPCGDCASVLTAPAGGVVVAIEHTVLQERCGGPGPPLGGVPVRALRRSGGHVEVPDPSRGEVRASGC